MAIHIFNDNQDKDNPTVKEFTECFYCGEPLNQFTLNAGGFVYWAGNPEAIALHQPCAELFALQLVGDAQTLVAKTRIRVKVRAAEMVNYCSDHKMVL